MKEKIEIVDVSSIDFLGNKQTYCNKDITIVDSQIWGCVFKDCDIGIVGASFKFCKFYNCKFKNKIFGYNDKFFATKFIDCFNEENSLWVCFNGILQGCEFINFKNLWCFDEATIIDTFFNSKEETQRRLGRILEEDIVGYKKCRSENGIDEVIVKLKIPAGAVVYSINDKKCRTNKAEVLEVIGSDRGYSFFRNKAFSYYPGDKFNIKNFNMAFSVECGTGIHFFKTKEEAEAY